MIRLAFFSVFFAYLLTLTSARAAPPFKVVDGDTFITADCGCENQSFRLLGVQTPEKSEKGYEDATQTLYGYLKQGFRLDEYGKDRYGRKLVIVTTADGICVNAEMRKLYKSNKYDYLLTKKQKNALLKAGW